MGNFFNLIVWQKAKDLAVKIYYLTKEQSVSKDFGFKDQIQRASVSISANIAEGDEVGSDKQSVRHFYIAKGSSAELMTLLVIGNEIGYFSEQQITPLLAECKIISSILLKLIKARS